MKNVIELLSERLPDAVKAIEIELTNDYAIKDVRVEVASSASVHHNFTFSCTDEVKGFRCAWSFSTMREGIEALKKELTPRREIKAAKRARAEQLLKEASES